MEVALEAGADDVKEEGDKFQVTSPPDAYQAVKEALDAAKIESEVAELTLLPQNTVDVDDAGTARKVIKLMERLDDLDDVQNVSANFNIAEQIMAEVEAE